MDYIENITIMGSQKVIGKMVPLAKSEVVQTEMSLVAKK